MDPIREGMTGSMVEDVQERLASLGYEIDEAERSASEYGSSTANAVARFRIEHGLSISAEVDLPCWSVLVDECYQMGDRTLYLRLPNFHGNDVRCLQNALNVLGFSCGEADGYYGPHTEGAVKLFQENVGMLADGIAFADTFDAIERLRHVWAGKPAQGPHPMSGMSFARAMSDDTGLRLVDSTEDALPTDRAVIVLAVTPRPAVSSVANVTMADDGDLALRLRTALESSRTKPPVVRIELPADPDFDGSFTINDAQMLAVSLVDTLCAALS